MGVFAGTETGEPLRLPSLMTLREQGHREMTVLLTSTGGWWVLCPLHTENPDSEATGFLQRKVDFIH